MPWATNDPKKMYKQIATAKYSFSANEWAGISDEAKSFISSLLVVDPAKRLTASGAMQHSWIVDECSKSCTSNNEKYNDSISSELEKSAMSIDVVEPYVPLKADGTTTGADTSTSNAMEDGSTTFNTSSPNNMAEVPRQVNAVGGNKKKGTVRKPAMAQINEGENEDEDSTPRDAERTTSKPTTRSSKRKKI
jgi:serine/threonine protein kinase